MKKIYPLKLAYIRKFLYLCAKFRAKRIMTEELKHKFEAIFAKVIDANNEKVELVSSPRMVKVPLADGLGIYYVFDYIIQSLVSR